MADKTTSRFGVSAARMRSIPHGKAIDGEGEVSPKTHASPTGIEETAITPESLNSGSDADVEGSEVPTGRRMVDMQWTRDRLKRFSLSGRQHARRAGSLRQTFVEHSS